MINHPNRRKAKQPAASVAQDTLSDHDYSGLLSGVSSSFALSQGKFFLTDASGLNEAYLDALFSQRQVHNCHSCRRFIETFGALVKIDEASGITTPVMWSPEIAPEFYGTAFATLHSLVKHARVVAPFYSSQVTWGTPVTGKWAHLAVMPPQQAIFKERLLTPAQAMAAAKENFRTVSVALSEFTKQMLDEAIRLLSADSLARSEKFLGPVRWLRKLHERPKGRLGENILWLAIASAPEGYCHPKASVIGPLLDDIASGLSFADIKSRFEAKVHPLLYQRPQAAPSAGNIRAAEAIFEKMGLEPALHRRFAKIEELQVLWAPKVAKPFAGATGGVFSHLKPKDDSTIKPVDMPALLMTWDKFLRTVLPNAEQMQINVPPHGRFIALTTAVHPDAPQLMKWDSPVAWYVYPGGSSASQWNLRSGWAKVLLASPLPTMWGLKPKPHLGEGTVLIIENCIDTRESSGNALFPECLREELHAVRSTIESYSRSATLGGRDGQVACGYDIRKSTASCHLRTLAGGAWTEYRIDRWD